MTEGKFSNPEAIQQTETDTDKTEESPTEEKTSEVLDVVEKQEAEKEIVLTPEQEKAKELLVNALENWWRDDVDGLLKIKEKISSLPEKFIQEVVKKDFTKKLRQDQMYGALGIKKKVLTLRGICSTSGERKLCPKLK